MMAIIIPIHQDIIGDETNFRFTAQKHREIKLTRTYWLTDCHRGMIRGCFFLITSGFIRKNGINMN